MSEVEGSQRVDMTCVLWLAVAAVLMGIWLVDPSRVAVASAVAVACARLHPRRRRGAQHAGRKLDEGHEQSSCAGSSVRTARGSQQQQQTL